MIITHLCLNNSLVHYDIIIFCKIHFVFTIIKTDSDKVQLIMFIQDFFSFYIIEQFKARSSIIFSPNRTLDGV